MSGKKKDDCKYQGEFTRHRRQNSMYHMKKYSRRGDWMKVRHPDEKRIVETENLKETSLINHIERIARWHGSPGSTWGYWNVELS